MMMISELLPFTSSQELSLETLQEFLRTMWRIRRAEERAVQLYTMGKIGGFCHVYIGQEAIATAASAVMAPQDTMVTSYRCHGHMIARGATLQSVLGELLGKKSGCSGGKGGSMHMFHVEKNFYGGHGIVGAQTALGTGMALAHVYKKDNGVCFTFLGDGATNQGQFFEAMNMAALLKLPVLYLIENNEYSMGTSVKRGCAGGALYKRGEPFGIQGCQTEGHDVQQLHHLFHSAAQYVREKQHPFIIEILTHRFQGHSVTDPGKYRTKDCVDNLKTQRDPIALLSAFLLAQGWPAEHLEALDDEVRQEVKDAIAQVEKDPEPSMEDLYTHVLL